MAKTNLKALADLPPVDDLRNLGTEVPEEDRLDGIDLLKINSILESADVSAGGFIRMERKGPFDDKFYYVARINAKDFDIDTIKRMYGGGEYQCKTFRANGQMYKPFQFNIDNRFKGQLDEQTIKAMAENPDAKGNQAMNQTLLQAALANKQQPDTQTPMMMKFMEMMGAKSDQNMMMMLTMMQQSAKQQSDTMMAMVTMMTAQKGGGSDMNPLILELLKQKSTTNPVEETLKLITMAKELVSGTKEEREPAMWEKIVAAVSPAVAPMLLGGLRPPAAATPATTVTAPPAEPAQLQSRQVQQQQPSDDMLGIRMFLGQLLKAAATGQDPALYADMIFANVSDEQLSQVRANLTDAAWPVNVFGDDPRTVQFRPWLEELKRLILTDVPTDSNPAESAAGGPGPDRQ